MIANNEKEFFISFDQFVPCTSGGCARTTNWGHAVYWNDGKELMLFPYCWEHGLALRDFMSTRQRLTAKQVEEQYASVERFVVGYHNGRGSASVINRCDPQDVMCLTPFIVEAEEEPDEIGQVPNYVWYVLYEFANTRQYGYVLFSRTFSRFEWYESKNGL
ncbi:MAG: hypothetical protein PVS3B3_05480 [Ktedonobacteraceae bacterium]